MQKYMNPLLRITKQRLDELSYKKYVQELFSDVYFISEQQKIFYNCPLQMFVYKNPTQ